jgi:hypothetical protein
MAFRVASLGLALSIAAVGCSKTSSSGQSRTYCEANTETIGCMGAGDCQGHALCNEDGSAFTACVCNAGTAGAGGLGGSGGMTSGTTGGVRAQNGTAGGTAGGTTGISTGTGGSTASSTFRRDAICDGSGSCTCTTLASLGTPASASYSIGGTNDFEDWLGANSNLQSVQFFTTDTVQLTAEWLAQWDVILLQDLRAFTFTTSEVTAFQNWIAGGGGVIALSGYYSDNATEIVPTNQLLASSGVQLLAEEVPSDNCQSADAAESQAVCPSPVASGRCYCWGVATPLIQWGTDHPISKNVKSVGAFRGRAVNPGTDGATVVSYQDTPVGASKAVGLGRIFVFGDDWVTYASRWGAYPASTASMTDVNSGCVDQDTGSACTAGYVFQTTQFWYNVISYVAPVSQCTFVISDPSVTL